MVTAHRRENLGEPLRNICTALRSIAGRHEDVEIVYPVHLNPAVQNTVREILGGVPHVHLVDPLDLQDMHNLIARCYLVMTDSGGLQEEAPSLGKPVLVLRKETERPEAVAAGTAKLAGIEREPIERLADQLLQDSAAYLKMARAVNPYGDGHACARIIGAIRHYFGLQGDRPSDFMAEGRKSGIRLAGKPLSAKAVNFS